MVPQKVLDTELKKSFAHFNEGRIPVSMLGFVGHSRVWVLPSKSRPFPVPNVLFQTWCVVLQRWCWRHPRGSDLLRMASFQNNIYHEKDDIRCVCACARVCVFHLAFSLRGFSLLWMSQDKSLSCSQTFVGLL